MTTIAAIHIEPYALPFAHTVRTATTTAPLRSGFRLALHASNGLVGWGDAAPWDGFGSGVDATRDALLRLLLPSSRLVGATLGDVQDVPPLLRAAQGSPEATFALETALLDLVARERGVPLAALLAPEPQERVAAATLVYTAEEATRAVDELGVACLKLKIGAHALERDLERVRAVRRAIGPDLPLRVDANGAFADTRAALAAARALAPLGPVWFEQPTPAHDLDALAHVRAHSPIPIAADESLRGLAELVGVQLADAADVAVIKPMFVGGLFATMMMARQARAFGLRVCLTHALESNIGRAATLHLAAALGHLEEPLGWGLPLRDDPAILPFDQPRGGHLPVPQRPGLGVEGLAHRPAPTPARRPDDIPHPVQSAALARPNAPAITTPGGDSLTARALRDRVAAQAGALRSAGLRPGARLAIIGRTDPAQACAIHATTWAGASAAPLDARSTRLADAARALDAEAALITAEVPLASLRALSRERPLIAIAETGADTPLPEPMLPFEGELAAVLTSGSTGTPRAIPLRTRQVVFSAFGSAARLGHLPEDRWLCCLPLNHVGGLAILLRTALYGTCAELHEGFDAARVASRMASGEVALVSLVPEMLERVLAADERRANGALRAVLIGGGPASSALLERASERGLPVALSWGMSEAASQIATTSPGSAPTAGEAGPPIAFARVEVDASGCLVARGPILEEGALRTSDRGAVLEDGCVRVDGRADDLIISGGEKIAPAPVEAALSAHPAVREAVVVGLPDRAWGARPHAALVLEPGHERPAAEALDAWCRQRLERFHVPDSYHWVEQLERTDALAKVSRSALRKNLLSQREVRS